MIVISGRKTAVLSFIYSVHQMLWCSNTWLSCNICLLLSCCFLVLSLLQASPCHILLDLIRLYHTMSHSAIPVRWFETEIHSYTSLPSWATAVAILGLVSCPRILCHVTPGAGIKSWPYGSETTPQLSQWAIMLRPARVKKKSFEK